MQKVTDPLSGDSHVMNIAISLTN